MPVPKGSKKGKCPQIPVLVANFQSGLTKTEVAKLHGICVQTIEKALKRHGIDLKALRVYKQNRADLLTHTVMRVHNAMTEDKINGASLRDLATSLNILTNSERLERGQSTSNISLASLQSSLADLEEQETKLKKELGIE